MTIMMLSAHRLMHWCWYSPGSGPVFHVYVHIAPYAHFGSIVGAIPVVQVAIGNSDSYVLNIALVFT